MNFTEIQQGSLLLEELNRQRESRLFCDVVFVLSGNCSFPAHKNILAASSPYFKTVLKSDSFEKEFLHTACNNSAVFRMLLDYIYTGRVDIDDLAVAELIRLATVYMLNELKSYCCEYLEKHISVSNCFAIRDVAESNCCKLLLRSVDAFIVDNIPEVVREAELMEFPLSHLQIVVGLFENDMSEELKLQLMMSWVNYDLAHRETFLGVLIKQVNWAMFPTEKLTDLLRNSDLLTRSSRCIHDLLQELHVQKLPIPSLIPVQEDTVLDGLPTRLIPVQEDKALDGLPTSLIPVQEEKALDGLPTSLIPVQEDKALDGLPVTLTDSYESEARGWRTGNPSNRAQDSSMSAGDTITLSDVSKNLVVDGDPDESMFEMKLMICEDGVFSAPCPSHEDGVFSAPCPSHEDGVFSAPCPPHEDGVFSAPCPSHDVEFIQNDSCLTDLGVLVIDQKLKTRKSRKKSPKKGNPATLKLTKSTVRKRKTADVDILCIEHEEPQSKVTVSENSELPVPISIISPENLSDYLRTDLVKQNIPAESIKQPWQNPVKTSIQCYLCEYTTEMTDVFHSHMAAVHYTEGPPYKCGVGACTLTAKEILTLVTHNRKLHFPASNKKSLLCVVCAQSFKTKSALNAHLKLHTGNKPYSCEVCMRSFATKGTLKQHMATHSDSQPYVCDVCGFKTKWQGHMTTHKKEHRGEIFMCDHEGCAYSTPKQSTLTAHMRVHTGVRAYTCKECGKAFLESSHLTRHKKIHLGDRPFQCEFQDCNYSSTRRDKLKEHIKKHHPGETGEKRSEPPTLENENHLVEELNEFTVIKDVCDYLNTESHVVTGINMAAQSKSLCDPDTLHDTDTLDDSTFSGFAQVAHTTCVGDLEPVTSDSVANASQHTELLTYSTYAAIGLS